MNQISETVTKTIVLKHLENEGALKQRNELQKWGNK